MTDEYSVETLDAVLREHLHEAARSGVPSKTVATLLRRHAVAIDQRGLDAHAGVTSIPLSEASGADREREREQEQNREADATP